jgi:hypothetical protein
MSRVANLLARNYQVTGTKNLIFRRIELFHDRNILIFLSRNPQNVENLKHMV